LRVNDPDRRPTIERTAEALNTSGPTLKRAMKDLGMGRWPPAPPED
jgi:AraC-like DNA-binding protein